jgi:transcriptional regulator with PAS, ATPase and Fis domain
MNGMRRRARKRLRPDHLIGRSKTPVYMVTPDRRISFFNEGCEALTGWSADDVLGQYCEFVTEPQDDSPESLAASLCPPAAAFAGRVASLSTHIVRKSAERQPQTLNFIPLTDEEGAVACVIGVIAGPEATDRVATIEPADDLHGELAALRLFLSRRFGTKSLVCKSDAMLRVCEQLSIARSTGSPVLIWGERGTGKEHLARAIHYESAWKSRAFIPLDCQTLSPLELGQTLKRLLFPSADEVYPSTFALRPGTLYLANVELLPRDAQQIVAEAFRKEDGRPHDLRLMASTTRDPNSLADDEQLRQDFFHLLTPLCIAVPSLRHRTDDLRLLGQFLLEELNRGDARQFNGFSDDVWEKFVEYNWPGNVGELLAVIREARALCNEPLIRVKDLPFRLRTGLDAQSVGPPRRPPVVRLEPLLEQTEREQIERALAESRHNKSRAAQLLGMTRPRLYRRMEILGIRDEPAAS